MKRYFRFLPLFLALLMLCFVFAACAKENSAISRDPYAMDNAASKELSLSDDLSPRESSDAPQITEEKIIEYVTLSVQTKTFDTFVQDLQAQTAAIGGYTESSDVDGSGYSSSRRSATFVLRIPRENKDAFSTFVGDNATVTSRQVRTENVTLTYVDIQSRLSAMQAERDTLQRMLEQADNVPDLLAIQSQLTDVIYRIESLQSQLRTYDNRIDYVTVTVYVYEVERTDVVEKQGVFDRIGTNLQNNFEDIADGAVEFFVWFVSALPYLVICAIVILIIILIVKSLRKRAKKRKKNAPIPTVTSVYSNQTDKGNENK